MMMKLSFRPLALVAAGLLLAGALAAVFLQRRQQHALEARLYGARRDLAEARYAYLKAWLRLRQLAGVLEDRDLAVLAAYFGAGEGRAQVTAAIR